MSSSSQGIESWISGFCSMLGHEYFAEVSEDFIEDDFNLTGLSSQVPMYKEALEMILDVEPEDDSYDDDDDDDDDESVGAAGNEDERLERLAQRRADRRAMRLRNDVGVIESSAELLYGLIHQRYITSRPGIGQMNEKYELGHFGACPRVLCNGCRVLPVGCSDTPGQETVKLFCPSCLDVYTPPNSRFQAVDGAFFGTTFGCLFLMTFPELQIGGPRPAPSPSTAAGDDEVGYNSNSLAMTNSNRSTNTSSSGELRISSARRANAVANQNLPTQPNEMNGVTTSNFAPGLGSTSAHIYEPRIYGFRVSELSRSGPRMKWLRMKPENIIELDEGQRYRLQLDGFGDTGEMQDEGEAADIEDDDEELVDDEEQQDLEDEEMAVEEDNAAGRTRQSSAMDVDGVRVNGTTSNKAAARENGRSAKSNASPANSIPGERKKASIGKRRSQGQGKPLGSASGGGVAMSMDIG